MGTMHDWELVLEPNRAYRLCDDITLCQGITLWPEGKMLGFKMKEISTHKKLCMLQNYVGVKMTGGPKRGQPWPTNIPSPVKPFPDEVSKFGALWGYKRKFKSGLE